MLTVQTPILLASGDGRGGIVGCKVSGSRGLGVEFGGQIALVNYDGQGRADMVVDRGP